MTQATLFNAGEVRPTASLHRGDDNEYLPIVRMRLASIADITEGNTP